MSAPRTKFVKKIMMEKDVPNENMNRRSALKSLAILSGGVFLNEKIGKKTPPALPYHFVGLGGAGCNVVERICDKGMPGRYTCISSPARPGLSEKITFLEMQFEGRPEQFLYGGRYRFNSLYKTFQLPPAVKNIFKQGEKTILFAGLGGLTGSCLITRSAQHLLKNKFSFETIVAQPFGFEGSQRLDVAEKVIKDLGHLPDYKMIHFDHIRSRYGNLSVKNAFARADEEMIKLIASSA